MTLAVRHWFYWDVVLVLLLALVLAPLVFYDGFPISHLPDSTVVRACSIGRTSRILCGRRGVHLTSLWPNRQRLTMILMMPHLRKISRHIYSTFGSSALYSVFSDAQEFLKWLRNNGCVVRIVSNVEYHYKNGSEWDFGVFSSIAGVEKQNGKMYEVALEMDGGMAPAEALHIGDSMCTVLCCM
ncbi:hypothetical protein GUJ93_ZPchr0004g38710 [Zizania palustris]|uniref:Uncharacterized protein n=1 Tax=Zizania palustris TaxID=103762 RepID=A0A8J5S171_ZIZPA|nr:hypothetical protein GUJ93_ZPchr0004g38710 [Zizania palustris]